MNIFKSNKYKKWYFSIINRSREDHRTRGKIYLENHHIIPKCLKGKNTKSNLVLLTAKEHYICHCCLVKAVIDEYKNKMIWALAAMKRSNKNQKVRSALTYAMSRKWLTGKNNPMYGTKRSEYVKQQVSKANKGKPGWNKGLKLGSNPAQSQKMKGNKFALGHTKVAWNKGLTKETDLRVKKCSDSRKERLNA